MFYKWEIEGFSDAGVGYIIVGGTDSSTGDDEVVVGGHAGCGFDDVGFAVGDYFDSFEVYAELETVFGEPGAVRVLGLCSMSGFSLSADVRFV